MQRITYKFIHFTGVEGAGKTTQIKLLTRWLESQGYKVLVVNIRTQHLGIYLLRSVLRGLGIVKRPLLKASELGSWRAPLPPFEKKLYRLILFLEIVNASILSLIRVYIPLALGYIVVAENYVIDICADTLRECLRLDIKRSITKEVARFLLRLMPTPSIVIILDASYEELIRRYTNRGSPMEPSDYIDMRRKQTLRLTRYFNYFYINTEEKSVAEVFREIKGKISCMKKLSY